MRLFVTLLLGGLIAGNAFAQDAAERVCPRPTEGAVVTEPPEVRSSHGLLDVDLSLKSAINHDGAAQYCYSTATGLESPTLRISPGDRVSIHFHNNVPAQPAAANSQENASMSTDMNIDCNGAMGPTSTNLHFHGLALPPVCHQDESMHTLVGPGEVFDYSFQVPPSTPPGLYWYHPHPHGFSEAQVQGGAAGALIVEGIDVAVPAVANLPHRTFILRDQLLPPAESKDPGPLTPSWDVSINYVPIKYPRYLLATIQVKAGERQFWRFVNAAANTIFNLQILYDGAPQPMEIYAIDGMPLSKAPDTQTSIYLPPGARVEFVVNTPARGQSSSLVTQKVDSGPTGDSAPARPLANIVTTDSPKQRPATLSAATTAGAAPAATTSTSLSDIKPVRTRMLYFSQNGNGTEGGAGAATKFFITVVGQPVKAFDMDAPPNIVARQGTVEDWNIQNTTPEDHIFHIHEVRFQLVAVNGVPVDDPVLRDTIKVPHQQGRTPISSIRVRVDFRDPAIVGDFVYHCHILGHEDKGMMGKIRVLPAETSAQPSPSTGAPGT